VQIILTPGGRQASEFSAEEIVGLARAIEGDVDAVRLYVAGASNGTRTAKRVIELLRGKAANEVQPAQETKKPAQWRRASSIVFS
jgi:hypothetical protein